MEPPGRGPAETHPASRSQHSVPGPCVSWGRGGGSVSAGQADILIVLWSAGGQSKYKIRHSVADPLGLKDVFL